MQFDSPIFFLGFLPVAIALIFLSTRRYSNVAIIILSLIFYTWGEPKFALIVVASAVFDCTVARRMYWVLQSSSPRYRKLLLLVMVLGNICLLLYHKYLGFLIGNLDKALSLAGANTFAIPSIALPIGVSFVVFEKITYVVDIDRGVAPAGELFVSTTWPIFCFSRNCWLGRS